MQKFQRIEKQNITGIILAGGKSRRMGTEKGLVEFMGKPLIEHAIGEMQKVAGKILISANTASYDHYGCEVIQDLYPNSGPMGGIYSCLERSETTHNLVLSCDTPFVSEELMKYILKNVNGKDIVAPWHGGEFFEPLCAYYSKEVLSVLQDFIIQHNYKIPDVFQVVNFLPLEIHKDLPFYHERLCYNINSKKELRAAERGRNE